MSDARAFALIAVVAVAAGITLALVSRAPESIREAEPPPNATDPARKATFTDEQIARHAAYRGPGYFAFFLAAIAEIAILFLLTRGPMQRIFDVVRDLPGGWLSTAVAGAALVAVILFLAGLPIAYVRGYSVQHAWELSTQPVAGWISDQSRALLVGLVMTAVAATAFYGLVRWQPRTWWLWGWAAFTVLTAILFFVYPVLIAPLFNRFVPLQPGPLREQALALSREAGVDVDEVLVADASRRTLTENAYVAGLGSTKRLVLYDTLVREGGVDESAFVIAHELGHEVHNHIWKNVAVTSAGLLVAFAVFGWLAGRDEVWRWAGATAIGDIRGLPVLLALGVVGGLIALPAQNAMSRYFERQADAVAFRLVDDPGAAVKTFRRLAFSNLADLAPSDAAVAYFFSHPPVKDRIRAALAETSRTP